MADTVLTLMQIENLMQSVTSTILGTTDPSAVRISWPTDGSPAFRITDDVCFIQVNYQPDPYSLAMITEYDNLDNINANVNTMYTSVIGVTWYFYGPNSFDHADLVRSNLFFDANATTFASSNLYMVADVPLPDRIPELFNGQWWNRSTFHARFNQLVTRNSSVPYLQSANITTTTN